MKTDCISVVLINYNCEKWLPKSMDSVLRQDWPELELIAVDDCSTDDSWAVMESFARRDSRVRLARTPENAGIGVARNLGMEMARGTYVAFLDSDDVFLPDTISSSHADFLRLEKDYPDLAMIMTDAWIISESGRRRGRLMPKSYWNRDIVDKPLSWVSPSTWFLRRDCAVSFNPGYRFGETGLFIARVQTKFRIAYVGRPGILYRYRIHSVSNEKAVEILRSRHAMKRTIAENRLFNPVPLQDVPAPAWREVMAWTHGRTAKSAYINGMILVAVWHGLLAALADFPRFVRRVWRAFAQLHVPCRSNGECSS